MADYHWSEKFSIGDAAIDKDHQDIFALIQELHEADQTVFNPEETIKRLGDYAEHHFAREEELMRSVGFPGYEEHIKEHQAFVDWIERIKLAYRQATASSLLVGDTVNEFMANWLTEQTEDMKYRDFIVGKRE